MPRPPSRAHDDAARSPRRGAGARARAVVGAVRRCRRLRAHRAAIAPERVAGGGAASRSCSRRRRCASRASRCRRCRRRASRRAATFALEDQLAGPADAHHLAVSRAASGRPRARRDRRARAARGIARSPDVGATVRARHRRAGPRGADGGMALVRRDAGRAEASSAAPTAARFRVDAPARAGALPAELALALAQARRDGNGAAATCASMRRRRGDPRALAARNRRRLSFAAPPWRWPMRRRGAFADAIDLLQGESRWSRRFPRRPCPSVRAGARARGRRARAPRRRDARRMGVAQVDAGARRARGPRLPSRAGVPADAAAATRSGAGRSRSATRTCGTRKGCPRPTTRCPLLARAAPALRALPAGGREERDLRRRTLDARPGARRCRGLARARRAHERRGRARADRDIARRNAHPLRRTVMAARLAPRPPAPLARWWSTKSRARAPDRRGVAARGRVAAFAGGHVWQPLARDIAAARAANARGAAALADAARMADEIAGSRASAGAAAADADPRPDLERVLVQQNLRAAVTQLDWQDGRARVVFAAVGYDRADRRARSTAARGAAARRRSDAHRARRARHRPRRTHARALSVRRPR